MALSKKATVSTFSMAMMTAAAVVSLRGLPISFPGTTGVPQPLTGGVLANP